MYSALVIASEFIKLGIRDNKPISPMKLQKIVYFAHGLHLARNGKPLINEAIQAWEYGPVIPVLYHHFKKWGNNPISETPRLGLFIGDSLTFSIDTIDDDAEQTIRLAWNITKDFSATQLSNWSHTDGSPWARTYDGSINRRINNDDIKQYFTSQLSTNG